MYKTGAPSPAGSLRSARQPEDKARPAPDSGRQGTHFVVADAALDLGCCHPHNGIPGHKSAPLLSCHNDAVQNTPRCVVQNLVHCSETQPGGGEDRRSFSQCRIGNRCSFPTHHALPYLTEPPTAAPLLRTCTNRRFATTRHSPAHDLPDGRPRKDRAVTGRKFSCQQL